MDAEKKDKLFRMAIIAVIFAAAAFSIPRPTVQLFCAIMGTVMIVATAFGFCPSFFIFGQNCAQTRKRRLKKEMKELGEILGD